MLNSMTGFARQVAESPLGTLTCEIRAVNHRYLDVQFRLPDELRAKEIEFKQQVGRTVRRGKVDCSIHFRRSEEGQGSLNLELVNKLSGRLDEIRKLLPDTLASNPVNLIDVLRWPGVVDQPEVEAEPLIDEAGKLLAETLAALAEMRASEGGRIDGMLTSRCDDILKIAAAVEKRMPEV